MSILKQRIISLKDRIDLNYEQLQNKTMLTKLMLININKLIDDNAKNAEICQYFTQHDNIVFNIEYYLEIIEHIKIIKDKRELLYKHKDKLADEYILIETALSVLEYLLSEDITNNERIKLFNNISNTIKIIENKITISNNTNIITLSSITST